ncbi:ABC transporter substrate-binding protein [uncultured Cetobacterium sp.]|uniref:ABC transporter substrate-binding protein n=2 Tax=uncultured Cetobacterium sp. TaxID=527638 RepID=UPI00261CCAE6|nr:ABC transporter substrate-binding protein [uncultured Cetobacterium sp.]
MKKLLLIVLGSFLFISCGGEKQKQAKDTLQFAQGSELRTLDPHSATDVYSRRVLANVFDRLVEKNENLEIIPGLAESWTNESDTRTVFKLRKNIKFQNGTPLTSKDVKYSLETAIKSPSVGTLYELIEKVETPDDYTAIIVTKKPFGALFHHLSHITASIMNKEYNTTNSDYAQKPMGTGPYKMQEWKTGDRVILTRFNDYFRGPAKIKNIHVRNVPEENSRVIGLQTGEIQVSMDITSIARKSVLEDKKLKLYETSGLGVSYIGLNTGNGQLKNKNIRHAVIHAIDRDSIIESIMFNSVEKAHSLLGPGVFGHSKEARSLDYNPNKSKELLKKAGFENGLNLRLITTSSETNTQLATVIQAQLKEVGINMSIEQLEWGAFLTTTGRGDADIYFMGWSNSSGDADYGLSAMLHSSMIGMPGNRSFFVHNEFDSLLENGKIELDNEKRKSLYAKAQDIMNDEVPIFPIYFQLANAGVNINEVEGYIQSPINNPNFYQLNFKK